MKYLIILVLLIFVSISILWIQYLYSNYLDNNKYKMENLPQNIFCTPMKGARIASQMGFPTINYKTDKSIPCGFYMADTSFGQGVLISFGEMPKSEQDIEIHYLEFDSNMERNKGNTIEIYNLSPVKESMSTLVNMFNQGCRAWKR